MKVEHIRIENFKRFREYELSFKNVLLNKISNRYLILGDNGFGKTTLLQAIALPLAFATGLIRSIDEFNWIGFLPTRYFRNGTPYIELTVRFNQEEINNTRQLAKLWRESKPSWFWDDRPFVEPGSSEVVKLKLYGDKCQAETAADYHQFNGRYYLLQLLQTDKTLRSRFAQIPRIFWFDQYRNLATIPESELDSTGQINGSGRISYEVGVSRLRKYLVGWDYKKRLPNTSNDIDYLSQLERLYRTAFPTRRFSGVEPMAGEDGGNFEDYFFLFHDGNNSYDLAEMSAGEQNIFPILYEFVRQQIGNSVILIDEVDLNLHPPVAQLIATQLPKIGRSCQFILTSHSEAVTNIISNSITHRLQGGALCL